MRHPTLLTPVLALACAAAALCLLCAAAIRAQQRALPPPAWARSAEVVDDGAVVFREARQGGPRRGTVQAGTRLPVERRIAATGCATGYWVQVAPQGFVCEGHVRMSASEPGGTALPSVTEGEILPHDYAFVGVDGTRAFARPSDYEADQYVEAFGEGFGLLVAGNQRWEGLAFVRTRRELWVLRDSLRPVRPPEFAGVIIAPGAPLDLAWVTRDRAPVFATPRARPASSAARRRVVHVAGEAGHGLLRLTDGTLMRGRDLARATSTARPRSVGPQERWIDVDVSQQVLVAYRGDRPVYATLVSTGRDRPGRRTPLGEFRIWVKLAESDMDDLDRSDVERNYSIEGVPWVQYFEGSNGLHAAFWHDDFGHRHSHGCINLAPKDAHWIFDFTRPALPAGWYAVLPTDRDAGTLVRVHDSDQGPRPGPLP